MAEAIQRERAMALRWVSAGELAFLTAAYFVGAWMVAPLIGRVPLAVEAMRMGVLAAAVYVAFISPVLIHGDTAAQRGVGTWRTLFVRTDNLAAAAGRFGLFTLAGAAALVALALIRQPDGLRHVRWDAFGMKLFAYCLFAPVQAYVMWSFMLPRFRRALADGEDSDDDRVWPAVLACALCFALFHAPNVPLMAISFVFAIASGRIYAATPNLFVASLSHALLGTILQQIFGLYTRVGWCFANPESYVIRNLFPFVKDLTRGML